MGDISLCDYRQGSPVKGSSSIYKLAMAGLLSFNLGLGAACWHLLRSPLEEPDLRVAMAEVLPRRESVAVPAYGRPRTADSGRLYTGVSQVEETRQGMTGEEFLELLRRRVEIFREQQFHSPEDSPANQQGSPLETRLSEGSSAAGQVVEDPYAPIRCVLEFDGVDPDDIPTLDSIRGSPSHSRILPEDGTDRGLSVMAKWVNYDIDDRTESHLYALVQDEESKLVTFHWYLCRSRDVSRVVEDCMPLVSMFIDGESMVSIGYYRDGPPKMPPEVRGPADFSVWSANRQGYISAAAVIAAIQNRDLSLEY